MTSPRHCGKSLKAYNKVNKLLGIYILFLNGCNIRLSASGKWDDHEIDHVVLSSQTLSTFDPNSSPHLPPSRT